MRQSLPYLRAAIRAIANCVQRLFVAHDQRDFRANLPVLGIAHGRHLLGLERTELAQLKLVGIQDVHRGLQARSGAGHDAVRHDLGHSEVTTVEVVSGIQHRRLLPADLVGALHAASEAGDTDFVGRRTHDDGAGAAVGVAGLEAQLQVVLVKRLSRASRRRGVGGRVRRRGRAGRTKSVVGDEAVQAAKLEQAEARASALYTTLHTLAQRLGIDYEQAQNAPGKPSDVFMEAARKHFTATPAAPKGGEEKAP